MLVCFYMSLGMWYGYGETHRKNDFCSGRGVRGTLFFPPSLNPGMQHASVVTPLGIRCYPEWCDVTDQVNAPNKSFRFGLTRRGCGLMQRWVH